MVEIFKKSEQNTTAICQHIGQYRRNEYTSRNIKPSKMEPKKHIF